MFDGKDNSSVGSVSIEGWIVDDKPYISLATQATNPQNEIKENSEIVEKDIRIEETIEELLKESNIEKTPFIEETIKEIVDKNKEPGNFGKRTIPSCVICPNLIKRATNSIKIGQRDNEPSLYAQTT